MSDKMIPLPFAEMLPKLLEEYRNGKTLMGVLAQQDRSAVPIGPAAGPHTQLSGNIVAAYAAGAACFELKTVQLLEGEALGIKKPCIYAGHEVFNIEWSSELTVSEALHEYIRAYLLIQVLSIECGFHDAQQTQFVMSVGYSMDGIRSEKIDGFLNSMKHAGALLEWRQDIQFLKGSLGTLLKQVTAEDISRIEAESCISDTVALSTMHGCPKEEIAQIAEYLIQEKGLNTYIKLNPTLIGREKAELLLRQKGYQDIEFCKESFDADISLDDAVSIIKSCNCAAKEHHKKFGVKMTNTFQVKNRANQLSGAYVYLSGPALYALAINAASELCSRLDGNLSVSYSGGADKSNVRDLLETGIRPVTVSSLLLKPGGYGNLSAMKRAALGACLPSGNRLDCVRLLDLAAGTGMHKETDFKPDHPFQKKEGYHMLCATCRNCVDVCPNRANIRVVCGQQEFVIHRDRFCNECGCCKNSCVMGHTPYQEKFTVFEDEASFQDSLNDGILFVDGDVRAVRCEADVSWIGMPWEDIIKEAVQTGKL